MTFNAKFLVVPFLLLTTLVYAQDENIDLKAMSDAYYNEMVGAGVDPDVVHSGNYTNFIYNEKGLFGIQFGVGGSYYRYTGNTQKWLGSHPSVNFETGLVYKNWTLGARSKMWTVNPHETVIYQGHYLSESVDLNPIKLDLFVSYGIVFNRNFSIEPSIGLVNNLFIVIHQDELRQNYKDKKTKSVLFDVYFRNHIAFKENREHLKSSKNGRGYFAPYIKFSYSPTDFGKIQEDMDVGFFEVAFGLVMKGYFKRGTGF